MSGMTRAQLVEIRRAHPMGERAFRLVFVAKISGGTALAASMLFVGILTHLFLKHY